jgi:hypothetical protein
MSLRSFTPTTQTAPVLIRTGGCDLVSLDGYAAGAGYLQLFNLAAVADLAGGTVPIKSFRVGGAGPLPSLLAFQPISFIKGLVVAFSSTAGTYTADATSFTIEGDLDEWERPGSAAGDSPDITGAVVAADSYEIWNNAAGPLKLMYLELTNAEGADIYFMLFAKDNPAAGTAPPEGRVWKVANGVTKKLYFGEGLRPLDAAGNKGCTIMASTTKEVLTAAVGAGCSIIAIWKLI